MESLELFLGASPNSPHPLDRKRFIKYAFDAARADLTLNERAFREAGVTEEYIKRYLEIYSWIRDIQEILDSGEL